LVDEPPPCNVACVNRIALRQELAPHAGANAIGTDEKVRRLHGSVSEPRRYAGAGLLAAQELGAEMIAVFGERGPEYSEQAIPRYRRLAAYVLPDNSALSIERPPLQDGNGGRALGIHARLHQHIIELRVGDDASAAGRQLDSHALIDVNFPTGP